MKTRPWLISCLAVSLVHAGDKHSLPVSIFSYLGFFEMLINSSKLFYVREHQSLPFLALSVGWWDIAHTHHFPSFRYVHFSVLRSEPDNETAQSFRRELGRLHHHQDLYRFPTSIINRLQHMRLIVNAPFALWHLNMLMMNHGT